MGCGVLAGISAKALYPKRTVISFAGDGCFLMTGQELATAVQYQLNVVIIVVNNNMYGTIRMHQEREYPGSRVWHVAGESGLRAPLPRRLARTVRWWRPRSSLRRRWSAP